MAKPTVTRTLNPLPFDDLEPKRFEDLVRALTYDFRRWRTLEATGRSGSDRGYDARGFEVVESVPSNDDLPEEENQALDSDRVWLIQCKREKKIGPSLAESHLSDIDISNDGVYGMILAACCDLSLVTREVIRSWARNKGIAEVYIWGKGELEDHLRQPKNDHILYSFFGISLQIRKRSIQSELRSLLATKRKCIRALKEHKNHFVLLRDPTDKRYPYLPTEEEMKLDGGRRWNVLKHTDIIHRGVVVSLVNYFAYLADDGETWDMIEINNMSVPHQHDDVWRDVERSYEDTHWDIWDKLPYANKVEYNKDRVIPFEVILEIDEHGDQYARFPHIYVQDVSATKTIEYLSRPSSYDNSMYECLPEKRIDYFSKLIAEKEATRSPPDPAANL